MDAQLEPTYTVRVGHDGERYAVFRDEFARHDYDRVYPLTFPGCKVASFGGFDNAYLIEDAAA